MVSKLVAVVTLLTLSCCRFSGAVVNDKIDRIIDLSTQLVKITDRIQLSENPGQYQITLEPSHRERLAYIDATIDGQAVKLAEKPDGSYVADLSQKKIDQPLIVTSVFTKLLQPYPAEIRQNERQLVRYSGSQTTLSPYLTKTSTTKIKLPQPSRLESFTKASKMTAGSSKLVYGPFKDVQPNNAEPLAIHFENNSPFVAVTNLVRTVELSPWARAIKIVNHVKVAHVGAQLKGPFSRIDYQRDHTNGISSVRNFAAELPKASTDIFYRDGIGNISTSNVRASSTQTIVRLKPRFPLFGGWGTDFNLGYTVPIGQFLNEPDTGKNHQLSLPFADILYESMFIEEAIIKIVLPAGASDVEVISTISLERLKDETSFSYLDVVGRQVVVLKSHNIVAQHLSGKPLIIRFNYTKMYMLQEPLLLLAAALGTLILTALYSKLWPATSLFEGVGGSLLTMSGTANQKSKSD